MTMIELDDTPAPLPTDEQIASLLQENERLQAELKKAERDCVPLTDNELGVLKELVKAFVKLSKRST